MQNDNFDSLFTIVTKTMRRTMLVALGVYLAWLCACVGIITLIVLGSLRLFGVI